MKLKPSTTKPSNGARNLLTSACWVAMFICIVLRRLAQQVHLSVAAKCLAPACDSASAFQQLRQILSATRDTV